MNGPAFLVGFAAEARIARGAGWKVGIGGGTAWGATMAARRLIAGGATGLVSFGLAGGLDPALPAGTVLVPETVLALGRSWPTDATLAARFGGTNTRSCLATDRIVASRAEKRCLWRDTGAACVDMESGAGAAAAAAAGLPFAVLRAICDPADRDLPAAALIALDAAGRLAVGALLSALLRNPLQIPPLIGLARDAAKARRALTDRIAPIVAARR